MLSGMATQTVANSTLMNSTDCSASKAGRCVAVVAALSAAVRWLQKWQWWRPTTGVAGHSRTVLIGVPTHGLRNGIKRN